VTLEKSHESAEYREVLERTQGEIARSTITIDGSLLLARVESVPSIGSQIEVIVSELADEVLQLVEVPLCLKFKSLKQVAFPKNGAFNHDTQPPQIGPHCAYHLVARLDWRGRCLPRSRHRWVD